MPTPANDSKRQPNFLIIVADDLGFSDCSCFGSEIETPNIDALAVDGAGLGQLAEYVRRSPAHQGQPGHEGYLNNRVVTLPELLHDGGYLTLMSGKWHLGLKREYSPQARGFDKSFALLPGCANHYGWEPKYSDMLNEPPGFFETTVTALHMENSDYVSSLPDDFYSSDYYASKLISYFSERTDLEKEKPFFAYLPFSAPHWPLQAPVESVERYKGTYSDGPDALRLRRLERLKALGLVKPDIVPHEVIVTQHEPPEWASMTEAERAKSARAMETYAGMVSRMDENIGRVLDYLRQTGEYDNTYIFFMSDNGAEGASYEAAPIMGDEIVAHIDKYYDNSLNNIGRRNSFVWYGPRWAQAATAPSRLYKMFSTQGGCRVPLVLKPAKSTLTDNSAGDRITDAFCTVMDFLPTILDLAGLEHPGDMYKGRQIALPKGRSWKSFLNTISNDGVDKGRFIEQLIHEDDQVTGWELAGSGALRKGRYKITYVPMPKGPQRWELFDIIADPGETVDISAEKSDIFEELLNLWDIYKEEVGVVGLAGELYAGFKSDGAAVTDEFEDTGRWIRFIGKKDVPPEFVNTIPV